MATGRPKKKRIVRIAPKTFRFTPRGRRGKPENVFLKLEELEAIRLADSESKNHSEAASLMNVSRQTFERVLTSARRTVADAITNGKTIKIWGGAYDFDLDPAERKEVSS